MSRTIVNRNLLARIFHLYTSQSVLLKVQKEVESVWQRHKVPFVVFCLSVSVYFRTVNFLERLVQQVLLYLIISYPHPAHTYIHIHTYMYSFIHSYIHIHTCICKWSLQFFLNENFHSKPVRETIIKKNKNEKKKRRQEGV